MGDYSMSGRGDVDRFEPPRFFRGIAQFCQDIQATFRTGEPPPHAGLRLSLPSLVAGDPAVAQNLYRGRPSSGGITDELLSLSWLPHMAASDLSLYRGFSRNLYRHCSRGGGLSTTILCRRLTILSRHADFLLNGSPADFWGEFFHTITRETRLLRSARVRSPPEELRQALTLLAVSLAFKGQEDLRVLALERAAAVLPQVILSDGGHVTRNPQALLDLLLDLIPIHEAARSARLPLPQSLAFAIGRACAMLRMMCHPDGGLALFQGVDNRSEAPLEAVLTADPHQQPPSRLARQSGFARLDRGKSTVIADIGEKGDYEGALSFEFSHGSRRIVTNCGTPEMASPAWRAAASSAAAHSRLQLHHPNGGRIGFDNPHDRTSTREMLKADVAETGDGIGLTAAQDCSGLVHHRDVFLANSGNHLKGEDHFANGPSGDMRFTLRFHLDPDIKAFSGRSGSAIMLMLPNRGVWQFSAGKSRALLEESVLLAGPGGLRPSQQIVIRDTVAHSPQVNWAFFRVEKPSRAEASSQESPGLPF